MATVLPFDPNARRRLPPRSRVPARPADVVERVVSIPVHPAADRLIERLADRPAASRAPVTASLFAPPSRHEERALAVRFFPLVALVVLLDLVSKAIAVSALGQQTIAVGSGLSLHLVYNTASAGGVWLGAYTRELNMVATGVVVGLLVMLVPPLARLDRHAPTALALMAGGGVGNLVSLVSSPQGVPDFVALHHAGGAWVVNVADLLMFAGLVLLGRTVLVLIRAVLVARAQSGPGAAALAGR